MPGDGQHEGCLAGTADADIADHDNGHPDTLAFQNTYAI
jgi:hypothetical protein